MRIHKCAFCGFNIYPGHGMMFVRNDSKCFRFCSKKCRVHFRNKRNPRRTKWTVHYHRTAKKELNTDTTFDLERRKNRPTKYDRNLMATTIRAMKEIGKIQLDRRKDHYDDRMKKHHKMKKKYIEKIVIQDKDLIVNPVAKEKLAYVNRTIEQIEEKDDVEMMENEN